jgi:hypothetical protein
MYFNRQILLKIFFKGLIVNKLKGERRYLQYKIPQYVFLDSFVILIVRNIFLQYKIRSIFFIWIQGVTHNNYNLSKRFLMSFYYLGRVLHCVQVGLYATSPHSLRSLRVFRFYPSRRYTRVYTHYIPALGMQSNVSGLGEVED